MRGLAAIAIALVACGAPAQTTPPTTPITNEVPTVDQLECSRAPANASAITLVAVRGSRRESICGGLAVRAGTPLDEKLVDADIRSLYKTALFEDITASLEGTTLVYELTERPALVRIETSGAPAGVQLTTPDFQIPEPTAIRRGAAQLRATLHAAGYRAATVEHALVPSGAGVIVRYTIAPGARTVLGAITFKGLAPTREALARTRLAVRAGQPVTDMVAEGDAGTIQTLLLDEGLLSSRVSFQVVDASASTVDLVFEVVEGPVFKLGVIKVGGPRARDAKAYAQALAPLKKGDIARRFKLADAVKAIEAVHAGAQPPVAVMPETNIQFDKQIVDMTFLVE